MKRTLYFVNIGIISLFIILSACKEELPHSAYLTIESNWIDHSFHLSADIKKSSELKILEQGFIVDLPKYTNNKWYDYGSEMERHTIIIKNDKLFETTLKGQWEKGLRCHAYAYIKTNIGNFRSEGIDMITGIPPTPEIHSITNIPSKDGIYKGGGILIIDGMNFPQPNLINIYIQKQYDPNEYCKIKNIQVTPTQIKAHYSSGNWNTVGEYNIKIHMGDHTFFPKEKIEVNGIKILSINPENPKHYQNATLQLENFHANEYYNIFAFQNIEVIEAKDNYLTIKIPGKPIKEFELRISNKYDIYSKPFTIKIAPSWENIRINGIQLGDVFRWDIFSNYACYYKGKTYLIDLDAQKLISFAPQTETWEEFPLPDIPNREFPSTHVTGFNMFGYKNYIYIFIAITRNGDRQYDYARWNYLYRIDMNTSQWERLKDIDNSINEFTTALTNNGIVYAWTGEKMMEYYPETDTWVNNKLLLPHWSTIIGSLDEYIYYHYDNIIFRINPQEDKEPEVMMPYTWPKNHLMMADKYIYYLNEYVCCRKIIDNPQSEIETMGAPYDIINNLSSECIFIHSEDKPYILWKDNDKYKNAHFFRYIKDE